MDGNVIGTTGDGETHAGAQRDFIDTKQPLMLCIYDKAKLTVSASGATLSSQNYSQSTALDLIARR